MDSGQPFQKRAAIALRKPSKEAIKGLSFQCCLGAIGCHLLRRLHKPRWIHLLGCCLRAARHAVAAAAVLFNRSSPAVKVRGLLRKQRDRVILGGSASSRAVDVCPELWASVPVVFYW